MSVSFFTRVTVSGLLACAGQAYAVDSWMMPQESRADKLTDRASTARAFRQVDLEHAALAKSQGLHAGAAPRPALKGLPRLSVRPVIKASTPSRSKSTPEWLSSVLDDTTEKQVEDILNPSPDRLGYLYQSGRGFATAQAYGYPVRFKDFAEKSLLNASKEVEEPAAAEALRRVQRVPVAVPKYISTAPVETSFFRFEPQGLSWDTDEPPAIVLLHGFDSSCLEYRRLAPLLAAKGGADVYGFDILGWGFNQLQGIDDFSPAAKTDHLHAFIQQYIRRPVVLVGASLGGAVAIDCAERYPSVVQKMVLIDAQGFIEGAGPAASLPGPFARVGISVLKSNPLRNFANQISYYNPKEFATKDAVRIGRLHCVQKGWDDASLAFLNSGGYNVTNKIAKVKTPALVLWGRQDKILDPAYAKRFKETLPSCEGVEFVDKCGHVPHLEKPKATAELIRKYLDIPKSPANLAFKLLDGIRSSDSPPSNDLAAASAKPTDTSAKPPNTALRSTEPAAASAEPAAPVKPTAAPAEPPATALRATEPAAASADPAAASVKPTVAPAPPAAASAEPAATPSSDSLSLSIPLVMSGSTCSTTAAVVSLFVSGAVLFARRSIRTSAEKPLLDG